MEQNAYEAAKSSPYRELITTHSMVDSMRVRQLLAANGVPFTVKGVSPLQIYHGEIGVDAFAQGPQKFFVPAPLLEDARLLLASLYDVRPDLAPDVCPACGTDNSARRLHCPECGLFLG